MSPWQGRAASTPDNGRQELLLSGTDWTIASFSAGDGIKQRAFAEGYPIDKSYAATVPGDIHWDLERAGKIPPIYFGRNSREIAWVTGREWWYRKSFRIPPDWKNKRVRLHFDAVDYSTEVWLNGQPLGRHEGQFTPFEFEVSGALRCGEDNTLAVLIHAAPAEVQKTIASGAGEWAVMQALRKAYPRWKCQTNAGWDWGAKIITMGIWQDVRLIATDGAYLSDLIVQPRLSPPYDKALLYTKVNLDSPVKAKVSLEYSVRCLTADDPPTVVTQSLDVTATNQVVPFRFILPNPRLWWPNGYGPQHRYELAVTVRAADGKAALDHATVAFGVRDLQMLQNPEALDSVEYIDYTTDAAVAHQLPQPPPERRYLIQINGRRIFGRGGNWIPCDLLYGRPRRDFYEHRIRSAALAHFNLFRVWGGGLIDKPVFFDLCDRSGTMPF
ncbi:MAG: beta galactosidase jelly roll domain-containing protein, partial [Candidatus Omnitrophica bacterium]|nr:beta galactosidase jelly roll domain-containing protein [Candidatus Omnitrophota bacterium]